MSPTACSPISATSAKPRRLPRSSSWPGCRCRPRLGRSSRAIRAFRPQLAAGGDDYELLFAAPAGAAEAIAALSDRLAVPITAIGKVEVGAGVRLVGADGR